MNFLTATPQLPGQGKLLLRTATKRRCSNRFSFVTVDFPWKEAQIDALGSSTMAAPTEHMEKLSLYDPAPSSPPNQTQPVSQPNGTLVSPNSSDPPITGIETVDSSTSPIKTPFLHPYPTSTAPSPQPLTSEESAKYSVLHSLVSTWPSLPTTTARNAPAGPLTPSERQFLTRECLLRYLRATKWSVTDASTRLQSTITWRREYGVESLTPEHISPENETGKQVVLGYDIATRPCLYLNPGRQNTKRSERQIQHLVFMLERTIEMMPPGQEALSLLINFGEAGGKGQNGTSLGQGKQVLNILQGHYPERMGRSLIINVPWAVWGFFKLITPFIDPLTREKLKFNEDLRLHVPPEQLLTTHGGDATFVYDHDVYWKALNALAAERRAQVHERWVKGGERIGESEAYLKGGDVPCLKDQEAGRATGKENVDEGVLKDRVITEDLEVENPVTAAVA